ncbi:hypothetical protein CMI47_15750 [Candidatus Pacearchaeota archaeon]|nr:hypothetical protein [Candidatus Pacearchaeota archaeon]|tara:strand:+ start:3850 stop:4677 length:828 start_codon:yes stop_codon:yes gene_type:complete
MSNSNKTLIAGPWSGEFGWELFAWHAYLRSLSEYYEKTIIISRSLSRALYEDFADQFIVCEPCTGLPDAFFMHGHDPGVDLKRIIKENHLFKETNISLMVPRRIGWPPVTHYTEKFVFGGVTIGPKYVIFKNDDNNLQYDYIFHARNRKLREEDNWSLKNWLMLRDCLGGKIASIGTKEEALCIEGTDDLRGVELKTLFGVLNKAKCAFGPSSGPMHLASLCDCPHVVWSKEANRLRYLDNWNPHRTPILFLSAHQWHPEAKYVYEQFEHWKETL